MKKLSLAIFVLILGISVGRRSASSVVSAASPATESAAAAVTRPAIEFSAEEMSGVQMTAVRYGSAIRTISAPARVGVDETKVVHVATTLGGWIEKAHVDRVGSRVRRGQHLLTVYNPQWQQEYRALVRRRTLASGEQDGTRLAAINQQLQSAGHTQEEVDAMQAARRTHWRLGVTSPITGVVLESNAVEKQMVTPDSLYTIADLSDVWVTADIAESDASLLRRGQSATLTFPALPGRTFRGEVRSILPELDPVTHTLKVRIQVPNPRLVLRPRLAGTAEFHLSAARTLLVPQDAVLNAGVRQFVFVNSGNGSLDQREVRIGRKVGDDVEIIGGLRAGERIANSGNFLLDSDARLASAEASAH